MEFANKVVVVTGAGRGIGRGVALAYAQAGAAVVVSDMNPDGGEETRRLITEAVGRRFFI